LAYEKTLGFFAGKAPSASNEAFLAEAYGRLLGVEELTRFYRRRDFDGSAARAKYIYNPDYAYAPWETIESLMGAFFAWLQDEKTPYFAKAVASLYYLDYLKPFDERNSSLASLLGKSVIANAAKTGLAFLLPLENIIVKTDRCKTIALETQRTGDLTFVLLYAIDALSSALEALTGELNAIRIATYAPEYKELSPAEKAESEKAAKSQQLTFFDAASAAPAASASSIVSGASIVPAPAPKASPSSESAPAPKITPASAPLPEKQKPLPAAESPTKPVSQPIPPMSVPPEPSIAFEPSPLSDKEAKEYVQYLLETNPRLSKNQASFLAFHCALGRYYTIQNFKDYAKCAYETARTSMDKLAAEGYYEKLQVKNKFVYTPVRKGDKKQ
jgi:Fic family protein